MAAEFEPKFYSELKGMNEDLLKLLKDTLEVSPYFDLSPTLSDYLKQFAELEKQYQPGGGGGGGGGITSLGNTTITSNTTGSGNLSMNAAPLPTSTNTTTTNTSAAPTPAFSFGAGLAGAPAAPAAGSVMPTFGGSQQSANSSSIQPPTLSFGGSNTQKPLFSFSMSSTNTSATAAAATNTSSTNLNNTTASNTSLMNSTSKPLFSFSAAAATTTNTASNLNSSNLLLNNTSLANNGEISSANETTVVEASTNTAGSTAAGAEGEDEAPPVPKVDRYEEPDYKYSIRCKLYERTVKQAGKDIEMLGIGTLFVKQLPDSPNKRQVIVRQEPDLRKVLLNEIITPTIPVRILPKAVQMSFPSASGEIKTYIAKTKDESDAKTLFDQTNLAGES